MALKNISGMDLTTDVKRADGRGRVEILNGAELDESVIDKESLKVSLKSGIMKKMIEEHKWIVDTKNVIKGEAKPAKKVEKAEAKEIEEKVEKKKKKKKEKIEKLK